MISPAPRTPLPAHAPSLPGLPLFHQPVLDDWIDYNGHLSEAYYVLAFGFATDALMDATGLDAAYRERTSCSLYTVEAHVRYLDEVPRGSRLTVRTTVLGVADKKLRFLHEMYATGTGAGTDSVADFGTDADAGTNTETNTGTAPEGAAPVATEELFALHVDQRRGGATPFPTPVRDRLSALVRSAPGWAGHGIREV